METDTETESQIAAAFDRGAGCVVPPRFGEEGRPKFEFHRFNDRRAARGAVAAQVKVIWPDGQEDYLWMSKCDIESNMKDWGACDGLLDALNAYRQNPEPTDR